MTLVLSTFIRRTAGVAMAWLAIMVSLLTLANAQPLESDADSDQLEAIEAGRQALEARFAALAFDDGSWSAYLDLCQTCGAERPRARDLAPALPQDPLGPLNLEPLQTKIQAQFVEYDDALWQQAGVSQAALGRYQQRCTACRSDDEIAQRRAEIQQRQEAWQNSRADCQAAAAPRQYGGQHRWHQDRAAAEGACQTAQAAAPQDPWASYLLWRSQSDEAKDAALLQYAVGHAVPPALAAAAWQTLASPPHDLARAQRLADAASAAGDLNGMVIATLIMDQQGGSPSALLERLQPALNQDHPWALQIAAKLEALPALKIAYLGLAAQQGDPQAQAALLRTWETNLSGSRLRQQAARAHIAAVVQGQPLAKSLWLENGNQRPRRLIKAVQAELIGLGLLSGSPDGIWGHNSEGALKGVTRAMVQDWILVADASKVSEATADNAADSKDDGDQLADAQSADDQHYEGVGDEGPKYEGPEYEGGGHEEPEQEGEDLAVASPADTEEQLADARTAAAESGKPIPTMLSGTATPEPQEASAAEADHSHAPSSAPLPKPKGELALVDPEEPEQDAPKKRGTVFKRKK